MKKARMKISHFRFISFNLQIFGEIVTSISITLQQSANLDYSVKTTEEQKGPNAAPRD